MNTAARLGSLLHQIKIDSYRLVWQTLWSFGFRGQKASTMWLKIILKVLNRCPVFISVG